MTEIESRELPTSPGRGGPGLTSVAGWIPSSSALRSSRMLVDRQVPTSQVPSRSLRAIVRSAWTTSAT